jgi:hypothetical protein
MGPRSLLLLLLLLHIAAAASRSEAAAFGSPTTGDDESASGWCFFDLRRTPSFFSSDSLVVAGSIVKQLSSVVKWPRGGASPHGAGPKQPAHSQYAGESPVPY